MLMPILESNETSHRAERRGGGQPFVPAITLKGGTSGFYSVKVENILPTIDRKTK